MNDKKIPRLKQKYDKEIVYILAKEFDIKNKLAVPRLSKVVINMGIGDTLKNKELLESIKKDLAIISGQEPAGLESIKKDLAIISGQEPAGRKAKISVASFGIRKGMLVGLKVTLRGDRMYYFLDRLFSIVLPRLRDFRGVSVNSFDKGGNYTLGIAEHTVFPEIDIAKSQPRGMEITIVTNVQSKERSKRLLELLGMPFEKR